jgi:hypothetical protein
MPIRIVIYGKPGDGAAFSAQAQIRALVNELRVDATVQIITDPTQLRMSAIPDEDTPLVMIDSVTVTRGYVPSRGEIARAIEQRLGQLRQSEIPGDGADAPGRPGLRRG